MTGTYDLGPGAGAPEMGAIAQLRSGPGAVLAALLVGGCLNGFVARGAEAWHLEGGRAAASELFGVSPFELLVAFLAAEALSTGSGARTAALGPPAAAFALAVAVPSGLVAWAATLLFGAWAALRCRDDARRGALLVVGLCACALWWGIGERFVGETLLAADATATRAALSVLVSGVQRVGNLVSMPWGHSIVILITCSTGYGMPLSVLSMLALASRGGDVPAARLAAFAAALALSYFAANVVRLCFLAWSDAFYHVGHGPLGMGAFDALATVMTLAYSGAAAGRRADAR